jgi:uncharacterized membrane protein
MGIEDIRKRYIIILKWGVGLGFILLLTGFLLFLLGVPETAISPDQVTEHWHLSAAEYHNATGYKAGWDWIFSLPNADYLSFASLVYFGLLTPICLASVFPQFIKEKRYAYAAITAGMLAILILAAAGIISS